MRFFKYHSLGNDFIIFDYEVVRHVLNDQEWNNKVTQLCKRTTGVGADCVLVIAFEQTTPELFIFNADGTQAANCLNGLRCVVHYLVTQKKFPKKFLLKIGDRVTSCAMSENDVVTTHVGPVVYHGEQQVCHKNDQFCGYLVSVGNPHYIIFNQILLEWLVQHGQALSYHKDLSEAHNVEFVWPDGYDEKGRRQFSMLVYERGCGITQACSSGAAALVGLLHKRAIIRSGEKICITMPGGSVIGFFDGDGVVLQACATPVFSGKFIGS